MLSNTLSKPPLVPIWADHHREAKSSKRPPAMQRCMEATSARLKDGMEKIQPRKMTKVNHIAYIQHTFREVNESRPTNTFSMK